MKNIQTEPGNLDPAIPTFFAGYFSGLSSKFAAGSAGQLRYWTLSRMFDDSVLSMWPQGTLTPWWGGQSAASQMAYECDAKLGSPKTVDCTQLQNQISSSTDTLQLGPEETKFLASSEQHGHSTNFPNWTDSCLLGTCHVAISTTVSIVLTWKQIQTALDALSGRCVSHPLQTTQGGRAYCRKSPGSSGRRKTKREGGNLDGVV